MQLCGDFKIERANFFTGSKIRGEIKFREWTEYDNWYSLDNKKLAVKDAEIWSELLKSLQTVYARLKNGEFKRFNRGLLNFQKGCKDLFIDFRLPYFVRSLEALVLPEKSMTEKQFKKRASKWWPKHFNEDAVSALGEIYQMRCDFDHLHGIKDRYDKIHLLRARQCEETARNAYQTILLENKELENFSIDEKIRAYWK